MKHKDIRRTLAVIEVVLLWSVGEAEAMAVVREVLKNRFK